MLRTKGIWGWLKRHSLNRHARHQPPSVCPQGSTRPEGVQLPGVLRKVGGVLLSSFEPRPAPPQGSSRFHMTDPSALCDTIFPNRPLGEPQTAPIQARPFGGTAPGGDWAMPRLGAQHTHTLTPQTTAVSSERARHQSGLESRWTTAPFACLKPLDRHGTKRKALPHRKCKGQGPQGESLSVKCQRYRLDPLLAALGAWDKNSNSTKSQDGHPSLGTLSFARRRRKMENLYCMATSGGHPARGVPAGLSK